MIEKKKETFMRNWTIKIDKMFENIQAAAAAAAASSETMVAFRNY